MGKTYSFSDLSHERGAVLITAGLAPVYKGGVRTDQSCGSQYLVAFPESKYQQVLVTVKGALPIVTQEDIDRTISHNDIPVVFEGFIAYWKQNKSGTWRMYGTANSVRFLKQYEPQVN